MSQNGKGETSTTSILFVAGAIGIGIWFLTVASDFVGSGTSPVYAVFFFAPICGVFLVVVVLAEVMKSLSGSTKNNSSGENTSSETSERESNNDISFKQIFVIMAIVSVILFVFFYNLAGV
jgi:phosphate/sulfate permease